MARRDRTPLHHVSLIAELRELAQVIAALPSRKYPQLWSLDLYTANTQASSAMQASWHSASVRPLPSPAHPPTGFPLHRLPSGTLAFAITHGVGVGLGAAVGSSDGGEQDLVLWS